MLVIANDTVGNQNIIHFHEYYFRFLGFISFIRIACALYLIRGSSSEI